MDKKHNTALYGPSATPTSVIVFPRNLVRPCMVCSPLSDVYWAGFGDCALLIKL